MPDIKVSYLKLRKITFFIFVACSAAIFISGFDTIIAKTRDVRRRGDIKNIVNALDLYYDKYGIYPESLNDWRGWELSYNYKGSELNFLKVLLDAGIIKEIINDPINDPTYYYRYQKYPAGSMGCEKSFYILQVMNFGLPTSENGRGVCPELDWVELAPNGYTVQTFE